MEINYQVIYKDNKNLYIRVTEEGIIVTAPFKTKTKVIEKFIMQNHDKLLKAEMRYHKLNNDEEYVYLLEEQFKINFHSYHKFKYEVTTEINIYGKQEKTVLKERFLKAYSKKVFQKINLELYENFLKDDFKFYPVSIKAWKNTYGKYYRDDKIVLNYKLIHLKKQAILHVLLHEYCHEKELNHSKRFYGWLQQYDDEYKINRKYIIDNINRYC